MTDELSPVRCGCGEEAIIETDHDTVTPGEPIDWKRARCNKCNIRTTWRRSEAEAITVWNRAMGERKIIHCIDCVYWMDNCVYLNDGRIRKYADGEKFVGADVGINEGSKCLYDEDHGVHLGGYAIFRQANDFCSKAENRHTDYDAWFGIKDGIYARRWKEDE